VLIGGEENNCGLTGHDKHSAELTILSKGLLAGDEKVEMLLLSAEYAGENSAAETSLAYDSALECVSKCCTLLCGTEVTCVV